MAYLKWSGPTNAPKTGAKPEDNQRLLTTKHANELPAVFSPRESTLLIKDSPTERFWEQHSTTYRVHAAKPLLASICWPPRGWQFCRLRQGTPVTVWSSAVQMRLDTYYRYILQTHITDTYYRYIYTSWFWMDLHISHWLHINIFHISFGTEFPSK